MKKVQVNSKGLRIGETHSKAKLSDCDIETIWYLHAAGLTPRQIAEKFDDGFTVSRESVRDILSGRTRGQRPARLKSVD